MYVQYLNARTLAHVVKAAYRNYVALTTDTPSIHAYYWHNGQPVRRGWL